MTSPRPTAMLDAYRDSPAAVAYLAALVLMAATLFALAIQGLPLGGSEGFYGPAAKCIFKTGDWLTTHVGPECDVYFGKGPLFYWTLAVSLKTFGFNETVLRVPSLLASVLTVVLTFHLIVLVTSDAVRAFLGGVVLLTTHQFAFHQREAIPDPWIVLFLIVGAVAYTRSFDDPRQLFVVGFVVFFPMLFKPVFPALLAPVVLLHLWVSQRFDMLRERRLYYGLVAGAIPFALWNVYEFWNYGATFLWEFWGVGLLGPGSPDLPVERPGERALEFVAAKIPRYYDHAFHWNTPYFYLIWLGLFYHPWLALAPSSVARVFKAAGAKKRFGIFALLWVGVLVLLLSGMRWRSPSYLLVIYPMLAALIGVFVPIPARWEEGRWTRWAAGLLGLLAVVKLGQMAYVQWTPGAVIPAGWRFEAALTAMTLVALGGWLLERRYARRAIVAVASLTWLVMTAVYVSLVVVPQNNMELARLRSYVKAQSRPVLVYVTASWLTGRDLYPLWWYFDDLKVCRSPECVTRIASRRPVVLATDDAPIRSIRVQDADLRFLSRFHFKKELDDRLEVVAPRDLYIFEFHGRSPR